MYAFGETQAAQRDATEPRTVQKPEMEVAVAGNANENQLRRPRENEKTHNLADATLVSTKKQAGKAGNLGVYLLQPPELWQANLVPYTAGSSSTLR